MKRKTKGKIIRLVGITFFIMVLIMVALQGSDLGKFIGIIISLFLIYEGNNIIKGNRSSIFDPPGFPR